MICKMIQFKDIPKANVSTKLWLSSLLHDGVIEGVNYRPEPHIYLPVAVLMSGAAE